MEDEQAPHKLQKKKKNLLSVKKLDVAQTKMRRRMIIRKKRLTNVKNQENEAIETEEVVIAQIEEEGIAQMTVHLKKKKK